MNMGGFGSPGVGEKEVVGQDEVLPKSARQSVEISNAPSNQITQSRRRLNTSIITKWLRANPVPRTSLF